jgi:Tfp pilus assembly protein PilV
MTTSARPHSQRGLALLEALFALGLASLAVWAAQQLMLARAQQASLQLHQAQALALLDDMAQRIRMHSLRFGQRSAQLLYGGRVASDATDSAPTFTCRSAPCDAAEFARWTWAHWAYQLHRTLPQAQAQVQLQGQRLKLVVSWAQPGAGNHSWPGLCPDRLQCEVLWL